MQVFWKITFPLLLPGILSAAMLAFALSFDDFIITQFNSGSVDTFPKFVYTAAARGIPPEANVVGSFVFHCRNRNCYCGAGQIGTKEAKTT